MHIAEQIAEEVWQVYSSGRNGIVLEMEHSQEWEPVLDCLQRQYLKGRIVLTVRQGVRPGNGRDDLLPVYCQRMLPRSPGAPVSPRALRDEALESACPASYLALGLRRFAQDAGVGMIVLENFHLLPEDARQQTVRALTELLRTGGSPLLLLTTPPEDGGEGWNRIPPLPAALRPYVYVIHGQKPDNQELLEAAESALERRGIQLDESFRREIASYLQGFRCHEVDYLFQRAELRYGSDTFHPDKKKILDLISSEKVKLLERERLLEWKIARHVDLANMDVLKAHLAESGVIMGRLEDAAAKGVDVPKGILIMGLPGTGKSLFAQYAAAQLQMPLLRLDMGRMMGGHVGDSERNLRSAQRQAEEMAPCILWIDEIEKGFAGSGGKREEGAYLQRMTGSFLTWLQEKKESCYIIATANRIDDMPPEFFRKGRFDECFYTAMPTENELKEILRVHLQRPGRAHVQPCADEAVQAVLQAARRDRRFMTGADASALVSNTFRRLYIDFIGISKENTPAPDKQEYDRLHLKDCMLHEFRRMKVFSETNGEELKRYGNAIKKTNFINVSLPKDDSAPLSSTENGYDSRLMDFISSGDPVSAE